MFYLRNDYLVDGGRLFSVHHEADQADQTEDSCEDDGDCGENHRIHKVAGNPAEQRDMFEGLLHLQPHQKPSGEFLLRNGGRNVCVCVFVFPFSRPNEAPTHLVYLVEGTRHETACLRVLKAYRLHRGPPSVLTTELGAARRRKNESFVTGEVHSIRCADSS